MDVEESSLLQLDNNILIDICELLDLASLCQMANVCKRFRSITEFVFAKRYKEFEMEQYERSTFHRVLMKFSHLITSLKLPEEEAYPFQPPHKAEIKNLDLMGDPSQFAVPSKNDVPHPGNSPIIKNFPKLESIEFYPVHFEGNDLLHEFLLLNRQLKKVQANVYGCVTYILNNFPKSTTVLRIVKRRKCSIVKNHSSAYRNESIHCNQRY